MQQSPLPQCLLRKAEISGFYFAFFFAAARKNFAAIHKIFAAARKNFAAIHIFIESLKM